MQKGIWALSLIFIFSLFIPPALGAKVRAEEARAEIREIRELEKRIEALEEEKRGLLPTRAEWLEIEGDIRLDVIVPEEVEPDSSYGSYVELDRVAIDLKATITENVYSRATIKFPHEARRRALPRIPARPGVAETPAVGAESPTATIEVDTIYTRFTLEDHWLMAGLTDRFIIPGDMDLGHRKTAGYPLSGIAFWRDEQYHLTLGGMFPDVAGGDFRYRLSYGSGLTLDRRRLQDYRFRYIPPAGGPRVEDRMLHDDDHGQLGDEIGLGLGYRYHFGLEESLDLMGFGIWSRAEEPHADVRTLIGWAREDDQHRIGGRAVYRLGTKWMAMAEYIDAEDGELDRDAWYLQASRMFSFAPLIGGRFLTAVEPLIRYGRYDVDTTKVFTNPFTWDREQITLALLCDIAANVSLRIEYDINDEETGDREIGNDEFRVQVRTRF